MAEENPKPKDTTEKFSERHEIKELLQDLKIELAQQGEVIQAIDQRFESRKNSKFKESKDSRLEVAASIVQGMETPEIIVEVSRVIQEEIIEGEMKAGDLKSLTITDLIDLEADRPGILLFAFTTWGEAHKDVSIEQFGLYTNPAPGTEMKIDFRGNQDAYWKVGAGDLLPPSVDTIKVTDLQGSTRIGQRRSSPRNGFYDANGYLSIFDGYKITIARPDEYVGSEPVKERPADKKTRREYRVDVFDTTGKHRRRARQEARQWAKDHGEKLKPVIAEKDITKGVPESWLGGAAAAADYYEAYFSHIDHIDPAVIFAIINVESSFVPGTPNLEGLSSALGLGQFVKDTWMDSKKGGGFLDKNKEIVESILGRPLSELSHAEKLNLRTHPIISIYAVTWLAAENAKSLGIRELTPETLFDVYMLHHEGTGGRNMLLRYKEYISQGHSEREAAQLAKLPPYKHARAKKDPRTKKAMRDAQNHIIYEEPYQHANEYIAMVEGVAAKAQRISRQYSQQLARYDLSKIEKSESATSDKIDYQSVPMLDRIAKNPKLQGHTLLIGSSSTVGYGPRLKGDVEMEAAQSRSIRNMNEGLRKMPLEKLRSFDRIVLQGGVKNTDRDDPTIDVSLRTMDAMVDYIRENAPNVKIYVMEITPWNAKYDPKIREFNDHLNSPEFLSKVEGVVPTYSIMDDGRGKLRPAFGVSDTLHVSRYDRYAGVVADWITRHEAAPKS